MRVTTIPACDYDAILDSQPATWSERGLHFHCFSWRGDGQSMQANETARNDPNNDVPPLRVRDWLAKPARLLRAAPATPEEAAAWLLAEYTPLMPQIQGDIGGIGTDDLMRQKIYDLRCGSDVVVVRWLRGGTMAHLAVLAVSAGECDRH